MALPCPAICLALVCLVSRLVRFVALKRHRSVSDWQSVGRLHQKQLLQNDVFCLSCLAGYGSPFSPEPGVFGPLCSRTLLCSFKPGPAADSLSVHLPHTHPSFIKTHHRSRHLRDVSSSSEHAGLSRPRLGTFHTLSPNVPTCRSSSSRAI